jgi:MoaA/NifB/PqqE/SkfB family radical SAM enzyme
MLPTTFTIETALGCNLRCVECAVGGGLIGRKHGMLSFDRFTLVADKVRPYCRYFYLHLWGEPMLNRDIFEIIGHASTFARTHISTNANTLDAESALRLITSGVADVIVSIDGFTQRTYEKYRRGGDVKKALRGLCLLQEFNRKTGGRVNIAPQFIVFEHNAHEMALFGEFCKSIGLAPVFKAPYLRKGSSLRNSGIAQFERQLSSCQETRKGMMRQCPNATGVFTMLLDGSVVACCYDHNRATCFGNIFESGVEDIWMSPDYVRFRTSILQGNPDQFCLDNCLLY